MLQSLLKANYEERDRNNDFLMNFLPFFQQKFHAHLETKKETIFNSQRQKQYQKSAFNQENMLEIFIKNSKKN